MAAVIQVGERGFYPADPARQAFETALAVTRLGFASTVLAPADAAPARGCEEAGVAWRPLALRSVADLPAMRELARQTRQGGPFVVHAHGPVAHAVALGAAALGGRFRLVVTRATTFPVPLLLRPALRTRRVSRVVATCMAVRRTLLEAGVEPARVAVVLPGVDLERLDPRRTRPALARKELGVPPAARLLVQVGTRDWQGWRELLQALPTIRAACPEAHLLLLGHDSARHRRWIRTLAGEIGVGEALTISALRDDIADVLAASEMVVDASWAGNDIPRALADAMALGKAVIATATGGSPELVEDGVTGLLVPPRDPATLAAAVVRLFHEVELSRALAAAARSRITAGFTMEHRAAQLATLYTEAVAGA